MLTSGPDIIWRANLHKIADNKPSIPNRKAFARDGHDVELQVDIRYRN